MGRLALTGMPGADPRGRGAWTRLSVSGIEDLGDAVYGAGLTATQMSRGPLTGSLAFAERDGVLYSSGSIDGRVGLRGSLSERRLTLGIGLRMAPGSRHWLSDVETGDFGVFLAGDEHDALYGPGTLYATVTLSHERLEAFAERAGVALNARALRGTGIYSRRLAAGRVTRLAAAFDRLHSGRPVGIADVEGLGDMFLAAVLAQFARIAEPTIGIDDPRGLARIVARARDYAQDNLDAPISIDALVAAAGTSRRTLHRAFHAVLDETPQSYVRKLRLHRIRHDLASDAEKACTVTLAANRWGISELGRLSGWYRELFGELPSQTLRQGRGLARSA